MVTGLEMVDFQCMGGSLHCMVLKCLKILTSEGGTYEIVDVIANLLVWSCEQFRCCLDASWRQWGQTRKGYSCLRLPYSCICVSYEPISSSSLVTDYMAVLH